MGWVLAYTKESELSMSVYSSETCCLYICVCLRVSMNSLAYVAMAYVAMAYVAMAYAIMVYNSYYCSMVYMVIYIVYICTCICVR